MDASGFADTVTLGLLSHCNLRCSHCYRPNSDETFSLSYQEVEKSLDEIFKFQGSKQLRVYFTGGEPCLWQDGDYRLLDLLLLVTKKYDSKPRFDTNGTFFADADYCHSFFHNYFSATNRALRMVVSCDLFHISDSSAPPRFVSYAVDHGSLPAVDQIIAVSHKLGKREKLEIEVLWVSSTLQKHAVPPDLKAQYRDLGVKFSVIPLLPDGSGKKLAEIAPRMRVCDEQGNPVSGRDSLGVFLPVLEEQLHRKGKSLEDVAEMTNEEIFREISDCGRLPNPFFCWNKKYYYCIPRFGDERFFIAEIGGLLDGARNFSNPAIDGMRREGILGYLERNFPKEYRNAASTDHFLRYAGCSLCRAVI